MMAYYNENDPKAAAWLRELILAGLIAAGDVDERSIVEVQGAELKGYTQCHFFAGIGGWSYALRLAGWPDDEPVWTGSCPCQPFSVAGKRNGTDDKRHLWPEFHRLITECGPTTIFGEQVASADGRDWLAGVRADLEALGYAVGAADLCAAGAGAPHIRQRLYWVADAEHAERRAVNVNRENERDWHDSGRKEVHCIPGARGEVCGLGDTDVPGQHERTPSGQQPIHNEDHEPLRMGNAYEQGPQGRPIHTERTGERVIGAAGVGFWSDFDLIPCLDGKARRVEPGTFPLAHGVPARMGRLRGYGNAIVPQVAAGFIGAFVEAGRAGERIEMVEAIK